MSSQPPRARRPFAGKTLARPFGIELQIHPSWIISLAVLTYAAYQGFDEPRLGPTGVDTGRVILAIGFGLAIAASIVIHELSHSLTARFYGLPVRRITLFAFGGVSQIEGEAPTPSAEFAVALAGPLSSIVLAVAFGTAGRLMHPNVSHPAGFLGELGWVNMLLALFNLIPAFPMDGGRLLRSGLWAIGSRARATRWAVKVGRGFALLAMGGGGALLVVPPLLHSDRGGSFGALWIFFIGLFIFNAAGAAGRVEGGDRPNESREGGPAIPLPGVQVTRDPER
jgi:Zn-dependent protease